MRTLFLPLSVSLFSFLFPYAQSLLIVTERMICFKEHRLNYSKANAIRFR